jgi:hypothetical protein
MQLLRIDFRMPVSRAACWLLRPAVLRAVCLSSPAVLSQVLAGDNTKLGCLHLHNVALQKHTTHSTHRGNERWSGQQIAQRTRTPPSLLLLLLPLPPLQLMQRVMVVRQRCMAHPGRSAQLQARTVTSCTPL